jgi:GNAT superfamily N-acetyltransferase
MEFELLGWPADGPTLRLDYEQFSYAGKFVMSQTGKAVARDDGTILAATAFDPDRTDESTLRVRYITVRHDRRGEGIGPRLLRFTAERARERGFERVCIAVNNPYAYEAAYRAGFAFTGERTGLAELVCAYEEPSDSATYRAGLDHYRERDLSDAERAFLNARREATPPSVVDKPT